MLLDEQIYEYKNSSFSELVREPRSLSSFIPYLPDTWSSIDAAFKNVNNIVFWFNNETGTVLSSDNFNTPAQEIESVFGVSQVDAVFIGTGSLGTSGSLYLFLGNKYYRYTPDDTTAEFASSPDTDFPKLISKNEEGFPGWSGVDAAFTASDGVSYLFNNANQLYYRSDTKATETTVDIWGVVSHTTLQTEQVVNAAYSIDGNLYLIAGNEYYRYSLGSDGSIPKYIDTDYPKTLPDSIVQLNETLDAAFVLNNQLYFFSDDEYYQLDEGIFDPGELTSASPITGSWGNLPQDIRTSGLSAAFKYTEIDSTDDSITIETLYLIQNDSYIDFNLLSDNTAVPYEIKNVNYEVIRLSSSTAEQLNQIVFAGEIDDLLQVPTQEINESPTISFESSSPENIEMNADKFSKEPTNSHLDFNSANGIYYWEVFFHTPFIIAQTLSADQKFEDAKKWYEYIFDPTEVSDYWKFLPFLAADPEALMLSLSNDLDAFEDLTDATAVLAARTAVDNMTLALLPYQDVFLGIINKVIYEKAVESAAKEANSSYIDGTLTLANIENWSEFTALESAISDLDTDLTSGDIDTGTTSDNTLLTTWISEIQEVIEIIKKLNYRIDLMANYSAQLSVYLEDPFDPHAIAALRVIAYRKTIVMRYIDNLLDWGDMLFRQYTRESINEARMLYILAYDILGEKPQNMGQVVLESTKTYNDFNHYTGDDYENYDFMIDLENTFSSDDIVIYKQSLTFAATQFDTITQPYFYLKENELFTEYWDKVEDRLGKIRACLNIDGVAQPLPLFQPPIDPMALVNAAAGGGGFASAAVAGGIATIPDYRFDTLITQSKDLISKLKSFGDNLLSTLEKKDSEEMSLLQGEQESMMLEMTTLIKQESIKEAEETLLNLEETKLRAQQQEDHYADLISSGYLPEELTQISMMTTAAVVHGISTLGKTASGLSYIVPQFTAGPFSFGVTSGGTNVGAMLEQFGEAIQSSAEGLSMGGEVAGVAAQVIRSAQDWELQKKVATSEIKQLDYQINAQKKRINIVQHELLMHEKDTENNQSISYFMKGKFSNMELYSWMSSKVSSLFYQTYKLAHDYAKQAEQAFIFEKSLKAGKVNYVSGMSWDSQKKGLLSGVSLELELDKMEKAYMETDSRRLEITKNISLLETDPIALLNLKNKAVCNIRLSEELFDYDFPGHFNRQIKSIALLFDIGEGKFINATLTQLSSNLVMDTDIKAVKHLIDPSNEPTVNVRANWRANQQIALSHVDQYTENNGMFELNFGDERYLPFEGTGAVSSWRLEIKGQKGSYNPADLLDVTIKLRYTAKQGGSRFETEVKGVLKPYNATSFFDMAYNFPDEWAALTEGDDNEVTINFNRDMFPNISSSKIIGMLIRYEYETGDSGAIFTIDDDLQVPGNTYLQPSKLSVGQNGSEWKFTLKGDKSTLKNAEMVLVYKAKV